MAPGDNAARPAVHPKPHMPAAPSGRVSMSTATAAPGIGSELALPCGAVLVNRLAKAGMSEQLADRRGRPTDALVRLYSRWAHSGAGLLITGNVLVDRRQLTEPYNVVVEDEADLEQLSRWALAARSGGAHAWLQLSHPGRQAPRIVARHPVAPSPTRLRIVRGAFATARELRGDEIARLVDAFGRAARIAERAAFTGVQIHAAHGYLVSQFLSPLTNRRQDEWGGTPERRMRFLLALVRAARSRVSTGFAVGVKLNSADFQRGGFSERESIAVVTALNRERVDLLELTGGNFEASAMWGDVSYRKSSQAREAYFLNYARKVRGSAEMPIMLTGGIRSPATMSRLIREGSVHVIGLARPIAVMPELPAAVLADEPVAAIPQPRRTGWRLADLALEGHWHNQQIRRLSRGQNPDPSRSLPRTALAAAATSARWWLGRDR
jgi:2,4-dienoyl-CoA reductase-like NADH-dependent reductase (Old Yellow Enzyme family)